MSNFGPQSKRPREEWSDEWVELTERGVDVRGHEERPTRRYRSSWRSAWTKQFKGRVCTYPSRHRTPYMLGFDAKKPERNTVTIILWRTESLEEITAVIAHCCMLSDKAVRVFDVRSLPP